MGSFSQTLFFGGVTQKPEIRLCSQAIAQCVYNLFCIGNRMGPSKIKDFTRTHCDYLLMK